MKHEFPHSYINQTEADEVDPMSSDPAHYRSSGTSARLGGSPARHAQNARVQDDKMCFQTAQTRSRIPAHK